MIRIAIGIRKAQGQVDIGGGIRQVRVMEHALFHFQVEVESREACFGVLPFDATVQGQLSCCANLVEVGRIKTRNHGQEGLELILEGGEFDIHVDGFGQHLDKSVGFQTQLIELDVSFFEGVFGCRHIHVQVGQDIGFHMADPVDAAVTQGEVGRAGFGLHQEFVAGEVAAQGMVEIAQGGVKAQRLVVVNELSFVNLQFPEAQFEGRRFGGSIGGCGIGFGDIPIRFTGGQHAQQYAGVLQGDALDFDFFAAYHRHQVEAEAKVLAMQECVVGKGIDADHLQAVEAHAQVGEAAEQAQGNVVGDIDTGVNGFVGIAPRHPDDFPFEEKWQRQQGKHQNQGTDAQHFQHAFHHQEENIKSNTTLQAFPPNSVKLTLRWTVGLDGRASFGVCHVRSTARVDASRAYPNSPTRPSRVAYPSSTIITRTRPGLPGSHILTPR